MEYERDQILAQFQELSGIDTLEECSHILNQNDWNLEVALNSLFNDVREHPRQERENSQKREVHSNRSLVARALSMVQWCRSYQPKLTTEWIYYAIILPIKIVVKIFLSIVSLFGWSRKPAIISVAEDVSSYRRDFEEEFGTFHPTLFEGSYNQALAAAKQELVFLMTHIYSPDNQDSKMFCQQTLTSPDVVNYINKNFIFWACSVKKNEGYTTFKSLKGNIYPLTAITVLKNNKMYLQSYIEGYLEPQPFVHKLRRVVENYKAILIKARQERDERALNQTIREEQDKAYEESLRADQEKEEKERLDQEIAEREIKKKAMLELLKERRREASGLVPDEPDPYHSECVKVAIRFPDGRSLVRRFLRSHSLKYLYYFVLSDENSPSEFELVTNYPKRVLLCKPGEFREEIPSFGDVGLGKSEVLFVHDLEA